MKSSDSITVVLNYNNINLPIIVKKFNKLYHIKDKSYQLFYPIKTDIKLKYNNKDLSSFLDQSIGLIFENREKVKLQIEPILGSKRQLIRKIKLNSQKNVFNNMDSETKIPEAPATNDRYKSIQTESLPKKNIKSFSPSNTIMNTKKKLPPIKNKNKNKIDISSYKICRDCLTNDTKYYCRKCNKFICSNCSNKKHKKHNFLDIDISNEKANIDKYKEEIITKLCLAVNNLDNLDNIQMNEINVDEWNKKYIDGINSLTQIAKDQKEELKNNKNNKENIFDKNQFLNRIKEEKEFINNISISTSKDPFQLFNDINKRERIINQTLKKGKNTTNKIEEEFTDIENEIDNILFELEEQIYYK